MHMHHKYVKTVSNADGSAFAVPVDDWPVMIRMEYNITIY